MLKVHHNYQMPSLKTGTGYLQLCIGDMEPMLLSETGVARILYKSVLCGSFRNRMLGLFRLIYPHLMGEAYMCFLDWLIKVKKATTNYSSSSLMSNF